MAKDENKKKAEEFKKVVKKGKWKKASKISQILRRKKPGKSETQWG